MSRILTPVECALIERALRSFAGDCIEVADAQRLADEMAPFFVDVVIDDDGAHTDYVHHRDGPRRHCETCFCGDDPTADSADVEMMQTPESLVSR